MFTKTWSARLAWLAVCLAVVIQSANPLLAQTQPYTTLDREVVFGQNWMTTAADEWQVLEAQVGGVMRPTGTVRTWQRYKYGSFSITFCLTSAPQGNIVMGFSSASYDQAGVNLLSDLRLIPRCLTSNNGSSDSTSNTLRTLEIGHIYQLQVVWLKNQVRVFLDGDRILTTTASPICPMFPQIFAGSDAANCLNVYAMKFLPFTQCEFTDIRGPQAQTQTAKYWTTLQAIVNENNDGLMRPTGQVISGTRFEAPVADDIYEVEMWLRFSSLPTNPNDPGPCTIFGFERSDINCHAVWIIYSDGKVVTRTISTTTGHEHRAGNVFVNAGETYYFKMRWRRGSTPFFEYYINDQLLARHETSVPDQAMPFAFNAMNDTGNGLAVDWISIERGKVSGSSAPSASGWFTDTSKEIISVCTDSLDSVNLGNREALVEGARPTGIMRSRRALLGGGVEVPFILTQDPTNPIKVRMVSPDGQGEAGFVIYAGGSLKTVTGNGPGELKVTQVPQVATPFRTKPGHLRHLKIVLCHNGAVAYYIDDQLVAVDDDGPTGPLYFEIDDSHDPNNCLIVPKFNWLKLVNSEFWTAADLVNPAKMSNIQATLIDAQVRIEGELITPREYGPGSLLEVSLRWNGLPDQTARFGFLGQGKNSAAVFTLLHTGQLLSKTLASNGSWEVKELGYITDTAAHTYRIEWCPCPTIGSPQAVGFSVDDVLLAIHTINVPSLPVHVDFDANNDSNKVMHLNWMRVIDNVNLPVPAMPNIVSRRSRLERFLAIQAAGNQSSDPSTAPTLDEAADEYVDESNYLSYLSDSPMPTLPSPNDLTINNNTIYLNNVSFHIDLGGATELALLGEFNNYSITDAVIRPIVNNAIMFQLPVTRLPLGGQRLEIRVYSQDVTQDQSATDACRLNLNILSPSDLILNEQFSSVEKTLAIYIFWDFDGRKISIPYKKRFPSRLTIAQNEWQEEYQGGGSSGQGEIVAAAAIENYQTVSEVVYPLSNHSTRTHGYEIGDIVHYGQTRHLGLDLHASPEEPVKAVANGLVIYSRKRSRGYGQYVVIEHRLPSGDKFCTVYGHLSRRTHLPPMVGSGVEVTTGQIIGYIGHDDENGIGGPHLHFAIRKGPNPTTFGFPGRAGLFYGQYQDTERHGGKFTEPTAFINNLMRSLPQPTSTQILRQHPTGSLVKTATDVKVWYVLGDQRRHIPSELCFITNNFNWHHIIEIGSQELSQYSVGQNVDYGDGALIGDVDTNRIYVIESNHKRHIRAWADFVKLGYDVEGVLWLSGTLLQQLNQLPDGSEITEVESRFKLPFGSVMKDQGNKYVIQRVPSPFGLSTREKLLIPFDSVFQSSFSNFPNSAIRVSQNVFESYPVSSDRYGFRDGTLVRYDGQTYLISLGFRRLFSSEGVKRAYGFTWQPVDISGWSLTELNYYHPEGLVIH